MIIEDRDKIREATGIPGKRYDGHADLPVSDSGDPLQDIINDINTRIEHDNKYWGYA
jgi:hypothetical protein